MQDRPIGEDSTAEERAVVNQPRYTTFRSLDTLFTRGEAALKMVRDFSQCGFENLKNTALRELSDPNKIYVVDLYDRPLSEVKELLEARDITFETRFMRADKACSFKNLQQMYRTVSPGDNVELITSDYEKVFAVRFVEGNDNENTPGR